MVCSSCCFVLSSGIVLYSRIPYVVCFFQVFFSDVYLFLSYILIRRNYHTLGLDTPECDSHWHLAFIAVYSFPKLDNA